MLKLEVGQLSYSLLNFVRINDHFEEKFATTVFNIYALKVTLVERVNKAKVVVYFDPAIQAQYYANMVFRISPFG